MPERYRKIEQRLDCELPSTFGRLITSARGAPSSRGTRARCMIHLQPFFLWLLKGDCIGAARRNCRTMTHLCRIAPFFLFAQLWLLLGSPVASRAADNAYVIGAADVLEIQVWDNKDLNQVV